MSGGRRVECGADRAFVGATFGHSIAAVRVSTAHGIVITAACAGDDLIETRIAVGPEGTCACTRRVGETHRNDTDGRGA